MNINSGGTVFRSPRRMGPRIRRRPRRKPALRRLFARLFSHLALGFLLVGCASSRPMMDEAAVQSSARRADANERARGYAGLTVDRCRENARPGAVATLAAAAVNERSVIARSAALHSLATFNDPAVKSVMVQSANDVSPFVRLEAARGLASRLDDETVQALGRMAARDLDVDVRRAAVEALGKAGDSKTKSAALAQLAPCVLDADFTVARAAAKILEARTGRTYGVHYDEWAAYLHLPPIQNASRPANALLAN